MKINELRYLIAAAMVLLLVAGCNNRRQPATVDNKVAEEAMDSVAVVEECKIDSVRGDSIVAKLWDEGCEVWDFSDGVAVVMGKKCGLIDRSGNFVIPLKYDNIQPPTDGVAGVCLDGKWGYVDMRDSVVVAIKYDAVDYFSEGIGAVKQGEKWGFVGKGDREVVPPIYDAAEHFAEGMAAVKLGGKYGYVDKSGRLRFSLMDWRGCAVEANGVTSTSRDMP